MRLCGSRDVGSIPAEGTKSKKTQTALRLFAFGEAERCFVRLS